MDTLEEDTLESHSAVDNCPSAIEIRLSDVRHNLFAFRKVRESVNLTMREMIEMMADAVFVHAVSQAWVEIFV
jgi:hypothetical protein